MRKVTGVTVSISKFNVLRIEYSVLSNSDLVYLFPDKGRKSHMKGGLGSSNLHAINNEEIPIKSISRTEIFT